MATLTQVDPSASGAQPAPARPLRPVHLGALALRYLDQVSQACTASARPNSARDPLHLAAEQCANAGGLVAEHLATHDCDSDSDGYAPVLTGAVRCLNEILCSFSTALGATHLATPRLSDVQALAAAVRALGADGMPASLAARHAIRTGMHA